MNVLYYARVRLYIIKDKRRKDIIVVSGIQQRQAKRSAAEGIRYKARVIFRHPDRLRDLQELSEYPE